MIEIDKFKQFIGKKVSPPLNKSSILKEINKHDDFIIATLENGWRGNALILKFDDKYLDDIIRDQG